MVFPKRLYELHLMADSFLCLLPGQAKCLLAGLFYSVSKVDYTSEEAMLG